MYSLKNKNSFLATTMELFKDRSRLRRPNMQRRVLNANDKLGYRTQRSLVARKDSTKASYHAKRKF